MYNYIVDLTLKAQAELLQMSLSKIFLFFRFNSLHAFLSSVDFFFEKKKTQKKQKKLSGMPSECQTLCKGYQQMTKSPLAWKEERVRFWYFM